MKNGKWKKHRSMFKDDVGKTCILSMFLVKWKLPPFVMNGNDEDFKNENGEQIPMPFYPAPYRTKTGAILFPARGYAWLMRDDVLAMIAWARSPHFGLQPRDYEIRIDEVYEFLPDECQPRPLETGHHAFAFDAIDWNVSRSMPDIFAVTVRWTEVMEKPSSSFSMTTSDLLSTCSGAKFPIRSILTNDMVKHAAWAAPRSSSGLVPGFSP